MIKLIESKSRMVVAGAGVRGHREVLINGHKVSVKQDK